MHLHRFSEHDHNGYNHCVSLSFSDAYRGSAIAFHHYLQLCPALQFHPEFLEVNIGGSEMVDALETAPSVKSFCGMPFLSYYKK